MRLRQRPWWTLLYIFLVLVHCMQTDAVVSDLIGSAVGIAKTIATDVLMGKCRANPSLGDAFRRNALKEGFGTQVHVVNTISKVLQEKTWEWHGADSSSSGSVNATPAVFLLVGPTAVGKTRLLRRVFGKDWIIQRQAASLFLETPASAETLYFSCDTGGYSEAWYHQVAREIGQALERCPYAVIAFDEIESCRPLHGRLHSDVARILQSVLKGGPVFEVAYEESGGQQPWRTEAQDTNDNDHVTGPTGSLPLTSKLRRVDASRATFVFVTNPAMDTYERYPQRYARSDGVDIGAAWLTGSDYAQMVRSIEEGPELQSSWEVLTGVNLQSMLSTERLLDGGLDVSSIVRRGGRATFPSLLRTVAFMPYDLPSLRSSVSTELTRYVEDRGGLSLAGRVQWSSPFLETAIQKESWSRGVFLTDGSRWQISVTGFNPAIRVSEDMKQCFVSIIEVENYFLQTATGAQQTSNAWRASQQYRDMRTYRFDAIDLTQCNGPENGMLLTVMLAEADPAAKLMGLTRHNSALMSGTLQGYQFLQGLGDCLADTRELVSGFKPATDLHCGAEHLPPIEPIKQPEPTPATPELFDYKAEL
eukprot:Clim_evm54s144 gene=Clim_evmTU54s144